jgi:hypothetical protein
MSVVGDDWESNKRYNLAEIYQPTLKLGAAAETIPKGVTKDEDKAEAPQTGRTTTSEEVEP